MLPRRAERNDMTPRADRAAAKMVTRGWCIERMAAMRKVRSPISLVKLRGGRGRVSACFESE